jgi:hypothetical protein
LSLAFVAHNDDYYTGFCSNCQHLF